MLQLFHSCHTSLIHVTLHLFMSRFIYSCHTSFVLHFILSWHTLFFRVTLHSFMSHFSHPCCASFNYVTLHSCHSSCMRKADWEGKASWTGKAESGQNFWTAATSKLTFWSVPVLTERNVYGSGFSEDGNLRLSVRYTIAMWPTWLWEVISEQW